MFPLKNLARKGLTTVYHVEGHNIQGFFLTKCKKIPKSEVATQDSLSISLHVYIANKCGWPFDSNGSKTTLIWDG